MLQKKTIYLESTCLKCLVSAGLVVVHGALATSSSLQSDRLVTLHTELQSAEQAALSALVPERNRRRGAQARLGILRHPVEGTGE